MKLQRSFIFLVLGLILIFTTCFTFSVPVAAQTHSPGKEQPNRVHARKPSKPWFSTYVDKFLSLLARVAKGTQRLFQAFVASGALKWMAHKPGMTRFSRDNAGRKSEPAWLQQSIPKSHLHTRDRTAR
jgi:hypothetical protein